MSNLKRDTNTHDKLSKNFYQINLTSLNLRTYIIKIAPSR